MTLIAEPPADAIALPVPAALLLGWDHLELWVGNARTAAHLFAAGYGFRVAAYSGPETGVMDRASYVLEQGAIRLVVTAPVGTAAAHSQIAAWTQAHGDGVRVMAWKVEDVDLAVSAAVARGAEVVDQRWTTSDPTSGATCTTATVRTYGDVLHAFVSRTGWPMTTTEGLFEVTVGAAVGLGHVDHVVGNVEDGDLDGWVGFYRSVFGFDELMSFERDQISTEFSALRSTVVQNELGGNTVVMPLNEPAEGRKKSQIQEYLDHNGTPGVQHIALHTDDIVASVAALRARGIRFLTPPATYYAEARARFEGVDLPWADLERLGILVDRESGGYLLQVFTEPFGDRPTLFFEVIQRAGATGFGEGNFKALFEAIEREQAKRGNL